MNPTLPDSPHWALAYFLTFHPYGTWLPGDRRGWTHRGVRARQPPSPRLEAERRASLRYPIVTLTPPRREIVRDAITASCAHRGWTLHELVVERSHIHVVVTAHVAPERVMQELKSWSTRHLRHRGDLVDHPHPWAEHGSTGYLYVSRDVRGVITYVLDDHHPTVRQR